jgi:hypothetical protein
MEQKITIRVQAKNGMFLGPDSFNGAVITVTDSSTGRQIANGLTSPGDSGTRADAPNGNTSPYPITTPGGNPTTAWVQADPETVNFNFNVSLSAPRTFHVAARIPLPPEQGDQFVSGNLLVAPGVDHTNGAGFVLEVPGLWVQPEIVHDGLHLRIRAKVTMMCGCMINANSPWLPGDFAVSAMVNKIEPEIGLIGNFPMAFQINSQFYVDVVLKDPGTYQIMIHAEQVIPSIVGIATTTIRVAL